VSLLAGLALAGAVGVLVVVDGDAEVPFAVVRVNCW
jgi:hypothetical protein